MQHLGIEHAILCWIPVLDIYVQYCLKLLYPGMLGQSACTTKGTLTYASARKYTY